jgi:hypothetical protein
MARPLHTSNASVILPFLSLVANATSQQLGFIARSPSCPPQNPVLGTNNSVSTFIAQTSGRLAVIEMLETADFFEQQIMGCRSSAAQSRNKNDREFWLKLAARWEGLLKSRQGGDDREAAANRRAA